MWYFAWILGTLLACFFAIIIGLWSENREAGMLNEETNNFVE